MRTITIEWTIPAVREGTPAQTLPKNEIDFTEVLIKAASATAFTSLAKVKPDATQTVAQDIPDGVYTIRFIVTDIFGKVGKPADATATVVSNPPGAVTNIKITVS